jgi:hypothetical protein
MNRPEWLNTHGASRPHGYDSWLTETTYWLWHHFSATKTDSDLCRQVEQEGYPPENGAFRIAREKDWRRIS